VSSGIEQRDPRSLKNHLVSIDLYGTDPRPEFVESVRAHGVLVPLIITQDGIVISGHSRRAAAIMCKVKTVPCIVSPLTDPDEIERALIESNRQREKTNEQKAREAAHLLAIEGRLALKRREQNLKQAGAGTEVATWPLRENVGENDSSDKTRDKVGQVVGMGGRTVARAVEVVSKIDEAKAQGDTATAEKLTNTLNTKGVAPALREARGVDKLRAAAIETTADPEDEQLLDLQDDELGNDIDSAIALGKEFDRLNRDVLAKVRYIEKLAEEPGGVWLDGNKLQEIETKIKNGLNAFLGAKPYHRCPYCGGKGCGPCRESGYVTRMVFDAAPEAKRKAVSS
jgi:ParB-like chromosome segregation protein Spo0J